MANLEKDKKIVVVRHQAEITVEFDETGITISQKADPWAEIDSHHIELNSRANIDALVAALQEARELI